MKVTAITILHNLWWSKTHDPVFEGIGNSDGTLVGERIWGRDLAEVGFCMKIIFEAVV